MGRKVEKEERKRRKIAKFRKGENYINMRKKESKDRNKEARWRKMEVRKKGTNRRNECRIIEKDMDKAKKEERKKWEMGKILSVKTREGSRGSGRWRKIREKMYGRKE